MEKTFDVIDSSGAIVNRVVLADGASWNPPDGCTISEVDPSISFGEPSASIPIPPRDMQRELDILVESDETYAKILRGFGRIVLNAVSNIVAKHNANLDLLVTKQVYTEAEASALKIISRDYATLLLALKKEVRDETDPTK